MDDASVQPQGESANHDHALLSALEIARQTAEEAGKEAERMQRRYQEAKIELEQDPPEQNQSQVCAQSAQELAKVFGAVDQGAAAEI